jgi:hypothetical protein
LFVPLKSNAITREAWNTTAQTTEDKGEKMQALSPARALFYEAGFTY